MPVKYRIAALFTVLVLAILTFVCGSVYYFSYQNRIRDIQIRLKNRAITTGRLLGQSGIFDLNLIQRIDASTSIALKDKFVEAYDLHYKKIYHFADNRGDSIPFVKSIVSEAREKGMKYFILGGKDAVAYFYADSSSKLVIISAALDEEGLHKLTQLRLILLLSFMAGLVIAILGGYFFSTRLLYPLRKITDEVNDISARSLTRRISTSGEGNSDEWFYLSNTLNQLLNRLQESFEVQGRFIANASHELSTPLTSISNQLEIALQRKRNTVEYEQTIHSVYEDVKHLNSLTLSLLEFAKASGTSSGLEIDLIRIDEVLLRLPAELSKLDPGYIVKLDFLKLPDEEEKLLLFGNEELLFSAIKNIVVNACKYSLDHQANVILQISENNIIITIIDKGSGISGNELEQVLQPFFRGENGGSLPGFGLGLPLANRIIKLHKGFIEINSILQQGTTISITFPLASDFSGL